jgi:hypothetical protein
MRVGWVGNIARMGEREKCIQSLIEKSERKRTLRIFVDVVPNRNAPFAYPRSHLIVHLFPFATGMSRPAVGRGMKLTTHLHVVPRLRMRGDTPPFPNVLMTCFLAKERIHLYAVVF